MTSAALTKGSTSDTVGNPVRTGWIASRAVVGMLKVAVVAVDGRRVVGGLSRYQRNLVRGLRATGADVSCVARFDRELPASLDYATGVNAVGHTVDGVPTRLVGPARYAKPWLPRLRHLTSRPRFHSLAERLFTGAYRTSLAKALPGGVDVVHYIGTGFELLGFAALDAARRQGAAFTVWPAVHPGTWGDSPIDVRLYDRADAVFCQSDHELEHLASLGVARNRLVRAWLAPATEATGDGRRFRERHGLGDRPLVLFIARKCRSKGYHALCAAMAAVRDAVPGVCLVTIGPTSDDGPAAPVPTNTLLDLGVADESDKADALAACDVFCMPSVGESFGIVYVEAWSYSKPVICGTAPASRELIAESGGGIAVGQDPNDVAQGAIRILKDPSLRTSLGALGLGAVRAKFNWPNVCRSHQDVFGAAIQRNHSKRIHS